MVRRVAIDGKLYAIVVSRDHTVEEIEFFTSADSPQQLGYMKRAAGYRIKPHVHQMLSRTIDRTQEVIFLRKGKIRVDFYREDQTYVGSVLLVEGDFALLADGGHGFEMIEESEIVEVKQGPYSAELDKTRFEGIESSKVRLI